MLGGGGAAAMAMERVGQRQSHYWSLWRVRVKNALNRRVVCRCAGEGGGRYLSSGDPPRRNFTGLVKRESGPGCRHLCMTKNSSLSHRAISSEAVSTIQRPCCAPFNSKKGGLSAVMMSF